jgi:hypothetical protein
MMSISDAKFSTSQQLASKRTVSPSQLGMTPTSWRSCAYKWDMFESQTVFFFEIS